LFQDFVQQKTQVQAACDLCHVLYTHPCLCASLGSTSARAPNTCCSCDQLQDNHSQQFCTAFPGYKGTQNQEQHPYTQVQLLVPHVCWDTGMEASSSLAAPFSTDENCGAKKVRPQNRVMRGHFDSGEIVYHLGHWCWCVVLGEKVEELCFCLVSCCYSLVTGAVENMVDSFFPGSAGETLLIDTVILGCWLV
jgi:hypothetical protein